MKIFSVLSNALRFFGMKRKAILIWMNLEPDLIFSNIIEFLQHLQANSTEV